MSINAEQELGGTFYNVKLRRRAGTRWDALFGDNHLFCFNKIPGHQAVKINAAGNM